MTLLQPYDILEAYKVAVSGQGVDALGGRGSLRSVLHAAPTELKATPLHIAAGMGHASVIERILELSYEQNNVAEDARPIINDLINCQNTTGGYTPLHFAAHMKRVQAVRQLVKLGADVDATARSKCESTALSLALDDCGDDSTRETGGTIEALIEAGADVTAANSRGRTPLMLASFLSSGRLRVVERLLDAGARVNARDGRGLTALHMAVVCGCQDTAKLLLSRGANVNAVDDKCLSIIHYSQSAGMTELLLESGAIPNIISSGGNSPLHWVPHSFATDRYNYAKALLSAGADPLIKCCRGRMASQKTVDPSLKKLLEYFESNHASSTPLQRIAVLRTYRFARKLLRAGRIDAHAPISVGEAASVLAGRVADYEGAESVCNETVKLVKAVECKRLTRENFGLCIEAQRRAVGTMMLIKRRLEMGSSGGREGSDGAAVSPMPISQLQEEAFNRNLGVLKGMTADTMWVIIEQMGRW